jgi:hypothetical protein
VCMMFQRGQLNIMGSESWCAVFWSSHHQGLKFSQGSLSSMYSSFAEDCRSGSHWSILLTNSRKKRLSSPCRNGVKLNSSNWIRCWNLDEELCLAFICKILHMSTSKSYGSTLTREQLEVYNFAGFLR